MGRPVVIDDEQLLLAAREVFLAKGVSATTAEVAERAGISQASIFKRYKTKQALFLAAMQAERDAGRLFELLEKRIEDVGVHQALVDVGVKMLDLAMRVLPLMVMSWSNRGEFGLPTSTSTWRGPRKEAEQFATLLEREMRAGRLRRQDPWIVVRMFMGALQSYTLIQVMFKQPLGRHYEPEEYVRSVVDVLWNSIAPARPSGSR